MHPYLNTVSIYIGLFICACLGLSAQSKDAIESVQDIQVEVEAGTRAFVDNLKPIFAELAELGAAEADLALVRETLGELNQLSDAEMTAILSALEAAINQPNRAEADASLEIALAGQSKVVESLRGIFERLRQRQLELTVASKAEDLRRRQAENQHRTEMLETGTGDPVVAEAEQRALEEAVETLTRELAAIQDAAAAEGGDDALMDSETLERMQALAEQATEQIENEAYDEAAQTQKELGEMLADLAAEAGLEQTSEEFLADIVRQLKSILTRQSALHELGVQGSSGEQEQIAVATESLRIPTENVNAPAGFQVANAAKAMRRALAALSSDPVESPQVEQSTALQALERAIELLEASLDEMEESDGDSEASSLEDLAQMYRQAENLQHRQNQQNNSGGSQSDQAQIARETAELQAEVADESPEAARDLGRAAARMAEALDPDLSEEERQRMLDEAAEKLAEATQSILSEGRERRNQPPGQGGGLQSMDTVILDDAILGPSELSPAEREAIESARREPVGSEYAPLVESYYEKLSRQGGGN